MIETTCSSRDAASVISNLPTTTSSTRSISRSVADAASSRPTPSPMAASSAGAFRSASTRGAGNEYATSRMLAGLR